MDTYPKIEAVEPLPDKRLQVTFVHDIVKIYDCKPLLKDDDFASLEDDVLFSAVKTDQGGYGVSWSDDIDLSESELWLNGSPAEPSTGVNPEYSPLRYEHSG